MRLIASPDTSQTLSLAAMFQSVALVHQLARRDRHDRYALRECALSLIRLDAQSVEDVYGTVYGVDLGLRTLVSLLSGKAEASHREIYQYAVAVHQLSTKLSRLQRTSDVIHNELMVIKEKFLDNAEGTTDDDDTAESIDDPLYESLADLYSRTISYLTPRIIVHGAPGRLKEPYVVNRVRTALFAGIRAAYLWQQFGGRRWHLLFNRKDYVLVAKSLLND